jgi:hypothetical protein
MIEHTKKISDMSNDNPQFKGEKSLVILHILHMEVDYVAAEVSN